MAVATLAGDLITDQLRATGIEGDGRPVPDSSVGLYGARTNLIPNGGFEQDVRYWAAAFGSIVRDTTRARFGAASARVTVTSSGQTVIVRTNAAILGSPLTPGDRAYGISLYATGNVVGKSALVYMTELDAAGNGVLMGAPVTTSVVLQAGWNDNLRLVAAVNNANSVQIQCGIQIAGLIVGDQLWIDGARCFDGRVVYPYIESSEVLVPFAPVPDLVVNGQFETDITGWVGSSTTVSWDAAHAKAGTHALKAVATANGAVFVQNTSFITGTPVPVSHYAAGLWYYAEGNVVGKTAQLSLTENGGASGPVTMQSVTIILLPGWNYLLAHGTPAQSDRLQIRALVYLMGAVIGDTYWFDDVRAGSGYTVPTPTTVSRVAGRIQLPTTGLSGRQGWVALGLTPGWTGTLNSQHDRPSMPLVLWQWADDATHRLRMTFDGAYATLERTNTAGSDLARAPWSPALDVPTTIVGQWDRDGVSVSVDGRPFVGAWEVIASDDFARANGPLGTTPVGSLPWLTNGASMPRIVSGRYEPAADPATGNGYAYLDFGEIPARAGGTVSYTGTGGTPNTTMAFASALGSLSDLLHILLDPNQWIHQYRNGLGSFVSGIGRLWESTLNDGSTHDIAIAVDGDTLAVEMDGERYSVKHESVARLASNVLFWEVNRAQVGGQISRWESIFAQRYSVWAAGGGHVPELAARLADVGSNGDGTGAENGDVRWVMTGAGFLDDADLVALHAATPDPDAGTVDGAARVKLVWPAETVTLWSYQRPARSIAIRRAPITTLTARRS